MTLLAHDKRGLPHAELESTCERLARLLRRAGARFSPSLAGSDGKIRPSALREAVDLFVRAEHVQAHRVGDDVIYVVSSEARLSLDLAKNVIIHFFVPRALIATALLSSPGPPLPFDTVRERVLALSRLFKYEFTFRADAPFEQIFEDEVATMEADGELARDPEGAPATRRTGVGDTGSGRSLEGGASLAPAGEDGRAQIDLYARLLENFVEGYRVAARGLSALLRGTLTTKEILRRAMTAGERMFLAGEIARREAVCSPLLENAYASFIDQGYLARQDGKLSLTASYATASAVATIEARILAMGA
jgi:glycerol-3-phosphate O-acyltransferase